MVVLPAQEVVAREVLHNFKLKAVFFLLLIFSISNINAQNDIDAILSKYNDGSIPYVSTEELRMFQLNNEVVILDSRESEEFKVSHLQNSICVGYDHFSDKALKDFKKDQLIVVYCSVGVRSENIAKKLKQAGFTNVKNLYGGIFQWKNKDFPVIDSTGNTTQRVHAYSRHWGKYLHKAEKVY